MRLWDTTGQEDYERLRILAYEGVDVVIMAFSLVNKNSFDNIFDKWIPEYKQHLAGIPVNNVIYFIHQIIVNFYVRLCLLELKRTSLQIKKSWKT